MQSERFKETRILGLSLSMSLRVALLLGIVVTFTLIEPSFVRPRNLFAIMQTFALLEGEMDTLVAYSNRKNLSPKLKAALLEVAQRRKRIEDYVSCC